MRDLGSPIAMPKELVATLKRPDATGIFYATTSEIVQRVHDGFVLVLSRSHFRYMSDRVAGGFSNAANVSYAELTIDAADLLHVGQFLIARRPVLALHDKTVFD